MWIRCGLGAHQCGARRALPPADPSWSRNALSMNRRMFGDCGTYPSAGVPEQICSTRSISAASQSIYTLSYIVCLSMMDHGTYHTFVRIYRHIKEVAVFWTICPHFGTQTRRNPYKILLKQTNSDCRRQSLNPYKTLRI